MRQQVEWGPDTIRLAIFGIFYCAGLCGGQVFLYGVSGCFPCPLAFLVVGFEECYAKALSAAAKTRQRHDAYPGRCQKIVHEALVDGKIVELLFDEFFCLRVPDRQLLAVVEGPILEYDGHIECPLRLYDVYPVDL